LQDLKFQFNRHGKPLLECSGLPRRACGLDFNVTHTTGLIGVAVAAGMRVGIDCEQRLRRAHRGAENVAARMFSKPERNQLLGAGLPASWQHSNCGMLAYHLHQLVSAALGDLN
jgi:phosphopantetheinyl transferase